MLYVRWRNMDSQMEWFGSVEWHWKIVCLMNCRVKIFTLCFQLHAALAILEMSR